jgi:hypothetical protein
MRKRKYDAITSPSEVAQGEFDIFIGPPLVVNISIAPANGRIALHDEGHPGPSTSAAILETVSSGMSPGPSTSAAILETVSSGMRNENEPGPVSTEEKTDKEAVKYGDVFALGIEEAREALSSSEHVMSVFLTKPCKANDLGEKQPYLTAWLSVPLGDQISKDKGKLQVLQHPPANSTSSK